MGRRPRAAAAFSKDVRGSVLIEFALVSIPFFMLLFGVLEVGIIFFGNSMLEKATSDAARLIRTVGRQKHEYDERVKEAP